MAYKLTLPFTKRKFFSLNHVYSYTTYHHHQYLYVYNMNAFFILYGRITKPESPQSALFLLTSQPLLLLSFYLTFDLLCLFLLPNTDTFLEIFLRCPYHFITAYCTHDHSINGIISMVSSFFLILSFNVNLIWHPDLLLCFDSHSVVPYFTNTHENELQHSFKQTSPTPHFFFFHSPQSSNICQPFITSSIVFNIITFVILTTSSSFIKIVYSCLSDASPTIPAHAESSQTL